MLLLEHAVFTLELLQSPNLPHRSRLRSLLFRIRGLRAKTSFSELLAPSRKHVRVDVQRLGNCLDLNPGTIAQLHCRALELKAVAQGLLWTRSPHPTPPKLGGSVYRTEGRPCAGLSA